MSMPYSKSKRLGSTIKLKLLTEKMVSLAMVSSILQTTEVDLTG